MRTMFQQCRLVHADLSEYNMLYHPKEKRVYIIDVSQSVEHEHPYAMDFLRMDCNNVNRFFKSKGVAVMTLRELFEFVTDPELRTEEAVERRLEEIKQAIAKRMEEGNDG